MFNAILGFILGAIIGGLFAYAILPLIYKPKK